jgi:hypothetical protein
MSSIEQWANVPDQSVLELWVESEDEAFVSSAGLRDRTGREKLWPHVDLCPGRATHVLSAALERYDGELRTAFTGQLVNATFNVRIVKPDGTAHGQAHVRNVQGKSSDVEETTIFISMRRAP